MENELSEVCHALDEALLATLDNWKAALVDAEESGCDIETLYCLYPRLASHVAWSRGALQGAQTALEQIHAHKAFKAQAGPVSATASWGGCFPVYNHGFMAAQPPCSCAREEAESVHRETRIIEETIIEETGDGRGEKTGRSGRRS